MCSYSYYELFHYNKNNKYDEVFEILIDIILRCESDKSIQIKCSYWIRTFFKKYTCQHNRDKLEYAKSLLPSLCSHSVLTGVLIYLYSLFLFHSTLSYHNCLIIEISR